MRTFAGGREWRYQTPARKFSTEVRKDHCRIDLLSRVGVGAVAADVSERPAGPLPVRVVQPRSIADEQQLDTAANFEPVVPAVMGAPFQLSRRPEHENEVRHLRWRLKTCNFGRRLVAWDRGRHHCR